MQQGMRVVKKFARAFENCRRLRGPGSSSALEGWQNISTAHQPRFEMSDALICSEMNLCQTRDKRLTSWHALGVQSV